MALPDFLANDLFPPGLHPGTETELRERCVDQFSASDTRLAVFDGLCRYREALNAFGIHGKQWIDGSFVDSSRLDPEDIDLLNLIPHSNLITIPIADRNAVKDLLDGGESTKPKYLCHTFFVASDPPLGSSLEESSDRALKYWKSWFSQAQDYSDPLQKKPAPQRGTKGMVEMAL